MPYNELNNVVVGRLSIERSKSYLSHIRAIMHLCTPGNLGLDDMSARSVRELMNALERELDQSDKAFEELAQESGESCDEEKVAFY